MVALPGLQQNHRLVGTSNQKKSKPLNSKGWAVFVFVREHRLYYIERIFDNTYLLRSYLKMNQEIVCTVCGAKHDQEALQAIKQFDMLCPTCKKGTCKIVNLSKKYADLINSVSQDALLP